MRLVDHPHAPYSYAEGIEPYSAGVIAREGYELVHITLRRPESWQSGIEEAIAAVHDLGLPTNAVCGFELRCPEPHTFDGFAAFNREYRTVLKDAGLLLKSGVNPIARTNVAPVVDPPSHTQLAGFTFVNPMDEDVDEWEDDLEPSFLVSGAGDLLDQADLRPEAIVGGEDAAEAPDADVWRRKIGEVMTVMGDRLAALGVSWDDVTTTNVYCAGGLDDHLASEVLEHIGGAAALGVHWHLSRPPIVGLSYEMDLRGIAVQQFT